MQLFNIKLMSAYKYFFLTCTGVVNKKISHDIETIRPMPFFFNFHVFVCFYLFVLCCDSISINPNLYFQSRSEGSIFLAASTKLVEGFFSN